MVRLNDIAKYLKISVATVSYSLNNDPRIPPETRAKVAEAAQTLGYKGKSGKASTKDGVKQIVLCLNSLSGDIFPHIVSAMKSTLNLNNCELMVYVGQDITRLTWQDGMLILNSKIKNEDIEKITARRIPVVLMDRESQLEGAVNITLDNFSGCYETTKYAIGAGAKTFAFIGGPTDSYESTYRHDGFCKALEDSGFNKKNAIFIATDFTYEGGRDAFRYINETDKIPDAIICANDETAEGIADGLSENKVEKRVIITGFDGVKPAKQLPRRFVTVKADHAYWATTSAYTMIQLLDHTACHNIKLPVSLLEYN